MNYFKDFKKERFHDENLKKIIQLIQNHNKVNLFEDLLVIDHGSLGEFNYSRNKKDYDVHLEFANYQVLIETKVDSPEGEGYNDPPYWQTDRIFNKYNPRPHTKPKIFIFLTYGLSEFYIRQRQDGSYANGGHCNHFKHITCEAIQHFIETAITQCNIKDPEIITWNKWLAFELLKRSQCKEYLASINDILARYKKPLSLSDYPTNRLNLYTPEFTIPFYFNLCNKWNQQNDPVLGRACVYPVGRGYSTTMDSIFNFWELWQDKDTLTCGRILNENKLYFEFNEDFNLHLKACADTSEIGQVKEYIEQHSDQLKCGFNATIEDYNQGAYTLFEWDLDILSKSIEQNINNIRNVLKNAINILR